MGGGQLRMPVHKLGNWLMGPVWQNPIQKHTEDNTVLFRLRDMIWHYRDCLGRAISI